MTFQDFVFVCGTTEEQFGRKMIAVMSQLREKNFTFNAKKSNSKPVKKELFFAILHFKGGNSTRSQTSEKIKNANSQNNNKQLESFFGLANVYRKMIPDFATKMLPLNDMRNSNFS